MKQTTIKFDLARKEFEANASVKGVQVLVRIIDGRVNLDLRPSESASWYPIETEIEVREEEF